MPVSVTSPTHTNNIWEPREKDQKKYLHFDRKISKDKIMALANDPFAVSRHAFFPLLRFKEEWTKFRKNKDRKKKVRPLRFASRLDAAIFARYRAILSEKYECLLEKHGLLEVPIAYRKIPNGFIGNKCNTEMARDVFSCIKKMKNCIVTVVDIKSYFESLDHLLIYNNWCKLLNCQQLPPDHLAVYNAVTKYSVVDLDKLISRLNLNEKIAIGNRSQRRMRKIDAIRKNGDKQICSSSDFRKLVAGKGDSPSLIQKNGFNFGIPQGTPISDIIANFYLFEFDKFMNEWAVKKGGIYRRYYDDIIIAVPTSSVKTAMDCKELLQKEIMNFGEKMQIQDKKVCIVEFQSINDLLSFKHHFGNASKNGLEYLGFEYNGESVKIRNSTISNAWRKMKRRTIGHSVRFVKRYRDKGLPWLLKNYPISHMETKILRDVTVNQNEGYSSWTFTKYANRANRQFSGFDTKFSSQLKRYKKFTNKILHDAFQKAILLHAN